MTDFRKPLIFVVKTASDLDKVRGQLLSGPPGAAFRDHYLAPLGLCRSDVQVVTADTASGWTHGEHALAVSVALGKEAAAVYGADLNMPHPAAVARLGVPQSLPRKLRALKRRLDTEHASSVTSMKSTDSQVVDKCVPICKADSAKQIVYGVVLDPYEVDAQGDWTSPAQVEETAHRWMLESRTIGLEHSGPADAYPVETWIQQYPSEEDYAKAIRGEEHRAFLTPFGKTKVRSGAWIVGTKLGPKEWEAYKAGDLDAYSIGAMAYRTPIQQATMPKVIWIDLTPGDPSDATAEAPEVPNP